MNKENSHRKVGLLPIGSLMPKVLILGSIPGDKSIAMQQYYAHPRNRFWDIIAEGLQVELPQHYHMKVELLLQHHIALWDVAHQAERKGSLDSAIRHVVPNHLDHFIENHPSLCAIAFNGNKAKEIYQRHFNKRQGIHYFELPSTSPANASYSLERLYNSWKPLFEVL